MTTAATHAPKHDSGQGAMWIYIVGDLFIFGGWFVFYLVYRALDRATFVAEQAHLDQTRGMLNTLVLLVSSWFVARTVDSARRGRFAEATRDAWWTIGLGALFTVSKAWEWHAEIAAGHTFTSSDFFMFYFFLTGVHVFHVLCGFAVLGVLVRNLRGPVLPSEVVTENCAAYWHMVDLLWVVIFALLYLLR